MTTQFPPLPEQEKRDLPIGDTVYVIRAYSEESMRAYATLACKERDALIAELAQALQGVIRVADRATVEFDAARAALAKVPKGICVDVRGN